MCNDSYLFFLVLVLLKKKLEIYHATTSFCHKRLPTHRPRLSATHIFHIRLNWICLPSKTQIEISISQLWMLESRLEYGASNGRKSILAKKCCAIKRAIEMNSRKSCGSLSWKPKFLLMEHTHARAISLSLSVSLSLSLCFGFINKLSKRPQKQVNTQLINNCEQQMIN